MMTQSTQKFLSTHRLKFFKLQKRKTRITQRKDTTPKIILENGAKNVNRKVR